MKLIISILAALANIAVAAEVPKSPYIAIVYRYGNAIIETNRDTNSFGQNDLRLLYTLTELSTRPKYRDGADAHLKWLLQNPAAMNEGSRPWMLWDRCFEISSDQSKALAEKASSIRAFAAAYQHTRDEKFLKLMESAMVPAKSPMEQISVAIDAWAAAARVPEPVSSKLRRFAESQDDAFLSIPRLVSEDVRIPMLCVSRYENTGNIKYRDLVYVVANLYKAAPVEPEMSPMAFGHIISLELAAWRYSAKEEYLDAARKHADVAVKKFWTVDNPIPTVTRGVDSLVLSLLELHLSILHITAVRCPPNTIDR
jgi:hypothetical protein